MQTTLAANLISALKHRGAKRIFGVPGGGSSLELIAAARAEGLEFIVTRNENSAVMMAAVTAELSGTLGVALTTLGPGVANAANGIAYACLDRAPVVVISDSIEDDASGFVTHQRFDQLTFTAPITKAGARLESSSAGAEIERLVAAATSPPLGPVLIELTATAARAHSEWLEPIAETVHNRPDTQLLAPAMDLLSKAQRPVVIAGLEARQPWTAAAVNDLVTKLNCPALTTYKAKGVVPDNAPNYVGLFTGGSAEEDCVSDADLILLAGVDPVELIPRPWRYAAPVIEVSEIAHTPHYIKRKAGLHGALGPNLSQLTRVASTSTWSEYEISTLRKDMQARLAINSEAEVSPDTVVRLACEKSKDNPRITVDAGAHMFSVMALWPCTQPNDTLISNGLSTMAFALPAAIASALQEPQRPVIAFTGDGGLLMCLGELATAVQCNANILIVVLNDGALSLIDIKQQKLGMETAGVRWPRADFKTTAEGLGMKAWKATTTSDYAKALDAALNASGPRLIDVCVDPSGYGQQLDALRN